MMEFWLGDHFDPHDPKYREVQEVALIIVLLAAAASGMIISILRYIAPLSEAV